MDSKLDGTYAVNLTRKQLITVWEILNRLAGISAHSLEFHGLLEEGIADQFERAHEALISPFWNTLKELDGFKEAR